MRLSLAEYPLRLSDKAVERRILRDIVGSLRRVSTLGKKLTVNPTVWYRANGTKATALVANQASFFSQTFQSNIEAISPWIREKEIEGQKIDAYAEFECSGGVSISISDLAEWLPASGIAEGEITATFAKIYGAFVQRAIFSSEGLPSALRSRANPSGLREIVRVGVEFETGNIASSFRALLKLNLLFRLSKIDLGVFITSSTKSRSAAVIWPGSNRNGSFEELRMRRWREVVDLPILGIGFEPDQIDPKAPIIRAVGGHLTVLPLGSTRVIDGKKYEEWKCPGQSEVWLKRQ